MSSLAPHTVWKRDLDQPGTWVAIEEFPTLTDADEFISLCADADIDEAINRERDRQPQLPSCERVSLPTGLPPSGKPPQKRRGRYG